MTINSIKAEILQNPDMLFDDAEIFAAMRNASKLGHNAPKVVDLRGLMIERLNRKINGLETMQTETIAAAHDFVAQINKVHAATIKIMQARNLNEFLTTTKSTFENIFEVDNLLLVLERGDATTDNHPHPALLIVSEGTTETYTQGAQERTILRPISPHAVIEREAFGSEAVIKLELGEDHVDAMLILSSNDPKKFTRDHATDLLDFLAKIIEVQLTRWLSA